MFAGIATTGLAARALGRSYIGIAETPELCRIAERRLRRDTGT
jgi:DNA modification methylase